jgi:hypothetical protein
LSLQIVIGSRYKSPRTHESSPTHLPQYNRPAPLKRRSFSSSPRCPRLIIPAPPRLINASRDLLANG